MVDNESVAQTFIHGQPEADPGACSAARRLAPAMLDASDPLNYAWQRQRMWSIAASQLKADLRRWRRVTLGLNVAAAVLATLGVLTGLSSTGGKVLTFLAALAIGVTTLTRPRHSPNIVRDWTRLRSVSEGIKSEVYLRLMQVPPYQRADADAELRKTVTKIEEDADTLELRLNGIQVEPRTLPELADLDAYVAERIDDQINSYYLKRAGELDMTLRRVRIALSGLALAGIVLAAAGGTWEVEEIAMWVPVISTAAAALTAYAAAERYDFLRVEYARTAGGLRRLRDDRADMPAPDFVKRAEELISVENQAWMVKLGEDAPDGS